jgi:hypothetical protein
MAAVSGREADPKVLKEMIDESPKELNFTHFLTLFGEKLHGKAFVSVPSNVIAMTTLFGPRMCS